MLTASRVDSDRFLSRMFEKQLKHILQLEQEKHSFPLPVRENCKPLQADLFHALEKVLNSTDAAEQCSLAEALLTTDTSGIAHLITARHATEQEKKGRHFEKAIETAKARIPEITPLWTAERLESLAHMEFAVSLWRNGDREKALDTLVAASISADSYVSQDMLDLYQQLLFTYATVMNRTDLVQTAVEFDPVPTAEWYFSCALSKFRAEGDTVYSRGALAKALEEGRFMASLLLGYEEEEEDDDDDEFYFDDEQILLFSEITKQAWESTPTALEWLKKHATAADRPQLFEQSEEIDEARLHKINRALDLGKSQMRREDIKAAKREFNMVLREADRLSDGGELLFAMIKLLADVVDSGAMLPDLKPFLDPRLAKLDNLSLTNETLDAVSKTYRELGLAYLYGGERATAIRCCLKALELWESSRAVQNTVNASVRDTILENLLVTLDLEKRYGEMESYSRELAELRQTYLSNKHLDVVEALMMRRNALHELEKHDDERAVYDFLLTIDKHVNNDEELGFECSHDNRTKLGKRRGDGSGKVHANDLEHDDNYDDDDDLEGA